MDAARRWLCLGLLVLPQLAAADDALWSLLRRGGHVILVRHAVTTPGVGDPEGMRLDDCKTQRNLSEAGREEAKRLGWMLRSQGVTISSLHSSPWCRCIDTARLATGREPELESALGNLFGRPERTEGQLAQLKPLVSRPPREGNALMVSHGSTIGALTGVSPATAEMVVLTPRGAAGFVVAGRLPLPQGR